MTSPEPLRPPRLPLRFLRWFCTPDLLEDVEGDLYELFQHRAKTGLAGARRKYAWDVLFLFRPGIIRNISFNNNGATMFTNHLVTAIRHAMKYKGYTALNLLGLVIGLTASFLIYAWVEDEISTDRHHQGNIYKIWRNMYQASGEIQTTGAVPQPMMEVLESDYPEVEYVTLMSWQTEELIGRNEEVSYEEGYMVSRDFLRMFSFPLVVGNSSTALEEMYSIVISRSLAEKYFDSAEDALGETLLVAQSAEFIVTGVFEDPGDETRFEFDYLMPDKYYIENNEWVRSWYNGGFAMYFSLRPGADIASVNERIEQEVNSHTNYEADERLLTQPFSETYLYSEFENGKVAGGRIEYVRILSGIGIFLLLMACINFMNLSTARSNRRSREIGVRKVLGAGKGLLRQQFFLESMLLSLAAAVVALMLVIVLLPAFNNLTDKQLAIDFSSPSVWAAFAGLTLAVGFISGSYPALLMPAFRLTDSLRNIVHSSKFSGRMRNGLVIFQFSLAILLIIGTIVVSGQIDYILNKNLGLDKENLLYFSLNDNLRSKEKTLQHELLSIPGVRNVSFSSGNPVSYGRSTSSASWEGKNPDDVVEINIMNTDPEFFPTMRVTLSEGRGFSEKMASDTAAFVINEVLAAMIGYEDPVGRPLSVWGVDGQIIGVVKDFHMASLYEPIQPLIIANMPGNWNLVFTRIGEDLPATIEAIEAVYERFSPDMPFAYEFVDQEYQSSYRNEMIVGTLVRIFALVAIVISCLGLLGLSAYSADRRAKEVGIRKVHGASAWQIVYLLSRDYGKLILIAFVIGTPLAFYLSERWLENFAFHTELTIWMFVIAGLTAFVIGAITVSLKSYQAATVNPVLTLKDE